MFDIAHFESFIGNDLIKFSFVKSGIDVKLEKNLEIYVVKEIG